MKYAVLPRFFNSSTAFNAVLSGQRRFLRVKRELTGFTLCTYFTTAAFLKFAYFFQEAPPSKIGRGLASFHGRSAVFEFSNNLSVRLAKPLLIDFLTLTQSFCIELTRIQRDYFLFALTMISGKKLAISWSEIAHDMCTFCIVYNLL